MNLHNIYKARGEDFGKLVCSNESCSIDCLENINFNKTTTLALIDGVIEGMEEDKIKGEFNLQVSPVHQLAFDVAPTYNLALQKQIEALQAQRALITKE